MENQMSSHAFAMISTISHSWKMLAHASSAIEALTYYNEKIAAFFVLSRVPEVIEKSGIFSKITLKTTRDCFSSKAAISVTVGLQHR